MGYSLTIFSNIFDNKTHRRMDFDSWDEFEGLLFSLSKEVKYKPKKGEYLNDKHAPLISPAIYEKGTTRANRNVTAWAGWAALDIDEYEGSVEQTFTLFKGIKHIRYSSASSTKEKPKFRVVFPLSKEVPAQKIKHLWYALNQEFGQVNDPQTKDLSRMYYIPAKYPNSFQFIESFDGNIIDPDKLMEKHNAYQDFKKTDKWPERINEMLSTYKKEGLTNTNITWSGYRDCPFVNQQFVAEYKAYNETGWYHKLYQIMVSIASKALRRSYPITPEQIEALCKEIDLETGGWYKNRPLRLEAARAIEFALKNA
tara:strand:- start:182 stop:1117 length:936 start_codon:yes stop_codon:yes gene_type:complete